MEVISALHRMAPGEGISIDDETWQDLAMDDVFAKIDRTESMPGRQVLYLRLREYAGDAQILAERARQHDVFRKNQELREMVQSHLARLDQPDAAYLLPFLHTTFPSAPRFKWVLHLLAVMPVICLLLGLFLAPKFFLVGFAAVIINSMIYVSYGQRIVPYFTSFSQISSMLGVAERLSQLQDPHELPELQHLRNALPAIRRVRKHLGWLVMDRTALHELVQALIGYLNIVFLFDIVIFLRSLRTLRQEQKNLIDITKTLGALDATISVASYIEGLAYYSTPTFVADWQFKVVDLFHPLIESPVGNTLSLDGRSAVITGPNMAGKTSFIRAVGISCVLAQTLNLCLSREAVFPQATVHSAIKREDKLLDGESYFFSEIKRVLSFTSASEHKGIRVLLIDEIFRGTNTVERIASSVAVLRYLAKNNLVFVTTHDIELQSMLTDCFGVFHFTDHVIDGKYGFDYALRSGAVRSRNAIRLLKLSGYPESITDEAEALAERLSAG